MYHGMEEDGQLIGSRLTDAFNGESWKHADRRCWKGLLNKLRYRVKSALGLENTEKSR